MEPADQGMEKRCARPFGRFPLGQQPGLKIPMIRYREAFQQFPAKLRGQFKQTLRGKSVGTSGELSADLEQVHHGSLGVKEHILTVGDDPLAPGLIDDRSQPAEGPSERGPRIIGQIPK